MPRRENENVGGPERVGKIPLRGRVPEPDAAGEAPADQGLEPSRRIGPSPGGGASSRGGRRRSVETPGAGCRPLAPDQLSGIKEHDLAGEPQPPSDLLANGRGGRSEPPDVAAVREDAEAFRRDTRGGAYSSAAAADADHPPGRARQDLPYMEISQPSAQGRRVGSPRRQLEPAGRAASSPRRPTGRAEPQSGHAGEERDAACINPERQSRHTGRRGTSQTACGWSRSSSRQEPGSQPPQDPARESGRRRTPRGVSSRISRTCSSISGRMRPPPGAPPGRGSGRSPKPDPKRAPTQRRRAVPRLRPAFPAAGGPEAMGLSDEGER